MRKILTITAIAVALAGLWYGCGGSEDRKQAAQDLAALQAERDALVRQKTEAEQRAAAEHESSSSWQMLFGCAVAGAVVLFIIGAAAGSGARGSGAGKGGQ